MYPLGSIYIAQARSGPVKIGCTTNIRARRKTLRQDVREPITIVYISKKLENALELEGMIHSHCQRKYKSQGEWYAINLWKAVEITERLVDASNITKI